MRVYVRLRDEEGYAGSYSTVQRYVRECREEMAREAEQLPQATSEGKVDVDISSLLEGMDDLLA